MYGMEEVIQMTNPAATKAQIQIAMQQGLEVAKQALESVTPVNTGKTKKGWRLRANQGYVGIIDNIHPASVYLLYGTRPRFITVAEKKRLSNINNPPSLKYGAFGPQRSVNHPGNKPVERYAVMVEEGAGVLAGEVAADLIIGFYSNHGVIQRRRSSGEFGKKF